MGEALPTLSIRKNIATQNIATQTIDIVIGNEALMTIAELDAVAARVSQDLLVVLE